jgi:hypothetical protein
MVKSLGAPAGDPFRSQRTKAVQEMADRLWGISLNDIDGIHRYIYEEFDETRQLFDNCQVRYMIDRRSGLINRADATDAVNALRDLDHVGFTEKLSETCAVIADVIGERGQLSSPRHENRSRLDERVDLSDPAILDFYGKAVQWDAFLYTAAQNRISDSGK